MEEAMDNQHQEEEEERQGIMRTLLGSSPYSRMAGGTEWSWCKAVSGGTGITVLGLLFESSRLCASNVQVVVAELQARHPRLRSGLAWLEGRPVLVVRDDESRKPTAKVEVVVCDRNEESEGGEWLREVVEAELQENEGWGERKEGLDPEPMMAVRLYKRANDHNNDDGGGGRACLTVLVLRLHTAICDRASAATILTQLVQGLARLRRTSTTIPVSPSREVESVHSLLPADSNHRTAEFTSSEEDDQDKKAQHPLHQLVAIEDAIPPGQANKPFWAHGVDLLGYSLGSRRHALLPFQPQYTDHHHHKSPPPTRRSEIVRHTLSVEHTQSLMQACQNHKTNRFGALSAAGLKATTMLKHLGSRNENFAIITLIDCRPFLARVFEGSIIGFYHSAILNTHCVNEDVDFWELARRCSNSLDKALANRKHWIDMGDVNLLMCQAMQFPQLTPWSSLRTSLMILFQEALFDDNAEDDVRQVGLLDYVGCASIHGVGPSIAVCDSIQQGSLKSTCVYPAPIHSRVQMSEFLEVMMGNIIAAL